MCMKFVFGICNRAELTTTYKLFSCVIATNDSRKPIVIPIPNCLHVYLWA